MSPAGIRESEHARPCRRTRPVCTRRPDRVAQRREERGPRSWSARAARAAVPLRFTLRQVLGLSYDRHDVAARWCPDNEMDVVGQRARRSLRRGVGGRWRRRPRPDRRRLARAASRRWGSSSSRRLRHAADGGGQAPALQIDGTGDKPPLPLTRPAAPYRARTLQEEERSRVSRRSAWAPVLQLDPSI